MDHIYKSTTGLKLISVEDPPEYVMPGVTQIPVARRRKQTGEENPFIGAMRNTMRMDPDVLMVGEVRDQETAKLLMSMVQSGHKALSTIHTESALGVFARLKSMGLESDVLGARKFISGLIFQTLVPVLCGSCKVEYDPTSDDISHALHERIKSVTKEGDLLFFEAQNTVENPNDCPHCKGRGIVGRTVCAEMVIPNAAILDCIRNNDQDGAYKQWRGLRLGKAADSMIGATALEHAIYKMRRGEVSPRDVEGALGLLNEFDQNSSDIEMEIQQLIGSEK
jgi:type II secretory ATPase GspE/PulE/Tfp pilus assembly ATPase PilB-like protein